MFDDDLPKKPEENTFPRSLDNLSIAELEEYIKELEEEIVRVGKDIEKKKTSHQAADSFFK